MAGAIAIAACEGDPIRPGGSLDSFVQTDSVVDASLDSEHPDGNSLDASSFDATNDSALFDGSPVDSSLDTTQPTDASLCACPDRNPCCDNGIDDPYCASAALHSVFPSSLTCESECARFGEGNANRDQCDAECFSGNLVALEAFCNQEGGYRYHRAVCLREGVICE